MPVQQASFPCPQCRQTRLFTKQAPNHIAHLIISLFLCGLWIPIWLLIALGENNQPYFCSQCGFSATSKQLMSRMQTPAYQTTGFNTKETWDRFLALSPGARLLIIFAPIVIVGGIVAFALLTNKQNTTYTSTRTTTTATSTYSPPPSVVPVTPLPQSKQSTTRKRAGRSAEIIITNAYLKRSPNENGEVFNIVPGGSEVKVIQQKGAWFLVQYGMDQGWLHGNDIKFTE